VSCPVKAKIDYTRFPVTSPQQVGDFPIASPQQKRQVRNKSITSWRGQKSVVSCRFPNSITMTCCGLVTNLLAVLLTNLQQVGSFPVYGEVTQKLCNGFLA